MAIATTNTIPDTEIARVVHTPRLSVLHAESFVLFVLFFIFAPLQIWQLQTVKIGGLEIYQVDPALPGLIRFVVFSGILITSVRIFAAFWMLEHDVAFKVLICRQSKRCHKLGDLACRAIVALTSAAVVVCVWRNWPVEVCFIVASLVSFLWDKLMLHVIAEKRPSNLYTEWEAFEQKVKTWQWFDIGFAIVFVLELALIHFAEWMGWIGKSPITWIISLVVFCLLIIVLEVIEVRHLWEGWKRLYETVLSEFKK